LSDAGVISAERWRENWRVVCSDEAVRVDVPRSRSARRERLTDVRDLGPGASVALAASAPRAAARCRAFAAAAGIQVDREYLAFPSASAPAYLVEDAPAPVRLFVANALVAPRGRWSLPLELTVGLVRRARSWRVLRSLAPGRVVVGTTT